MSSKAASSDGSIRSWPLESMLRYREMAEVFAGTLLCNMKLAAASLVRFIAVSTKSKLSSPRSSNLQLVKWGDAGMFE